jgi:hypothetical protein
LEIGLDQLNNMFNLYLKKPTLPCAKLEDVLQSLADLIGNLKETMQFSNGDEELS